MRRSVSCWSSSGAPPKAWTPCSATYRTKYMKSEGPQPTYPTAKGSLTSSRALCFYHRSPGSTLAKSLSGCVFTPTVVSIPRALRLFLIGLILCKGGKRSTLGLPVSLSQPAIEPPGIHLPSAPPGTVCWPFPRTSRKAPTMVQKRKTNLPHPPNSGCVYTVPPTWRRWGHHSSLVMWSGTRGQSP